MKAVQDSVAYRLGIDDGGPMATWEYAQAIGEYAVEVRVEAAT